MGLFSKKTYKPDTYAQEKYAKLNREDWEDYQSRYVPRENQIISDINNEEVQKADAVQRSDEITDAVFDSSTGAAVRNSARYGGMTAEQRGSFDKTMAVGKAGVKVGNRNKVRQETDDRMLGLESSMVNLGRAQKERALGGFRSVAQMEQSRNSTNAQISAGEDASKMALGGQLLGIGAMAAFAGI
ncbi:MAG TPA: hypothetical protein ENK38_01330 [Gammaproteobacteria bacterium]|nr:hypothetical protein [Gammaproteobacteria bacterium]